MSSRPLAIITLILAACAPVAGTSAAEKVAAMPAAAAPAAAPAPALDTDGDKIFYTLGQLLSRSLEGFALTPEEFAIVRVGLEDGVRGRGSRVDLTAYAPKIQELQGSRQAEMAAREKQAGAAFIEAAAKAQGASRSASGIVSTTLEAGNGASPTATNQVKVHYEGKLIDGTVFDSSLQRGEPASFPLNEVIPCWTEAVQSMKVGERSRIVCPSELAYGDRGAPPVIRPGATLVFEVQLLEILPAASAPQGSTP